MFYSDLFSEFNRELVSNSTKTRAADFSVINLYRALRVPGIENKNDVSQILKRLTKEQLNLVSKLLEELDYIKLLDELLSLKIYYQINVDPRNNENKSLYAKTVLPRFKHHQKRKHIGIHFGTLAKFPDGWTELRKKEARLALIKKGYQILTER